MSKVTYKGSYWDNDGKYQEQYNKAWKQLIPASGEAEDGLPEALRAISRIGYDYYNNGFCNLWDRWDSGDGYDEVEMSQFYEDFVSYLRGYVPSHLYNEFKGWLQTTKNGCDWGSGGDDIIDRIIDHIMEGVIRDGLLEEVLVD